MDRRTADFMRKMEYVNQDQQNALLALIDAIKAKVRYAKLKLKKCQKIYVYKKARTKPFLVRAFSIHFQYFLSHDCIRSMHYCIKYSLNCRCTVRAFFCINMYLTLTVWTNLCFFFWYFLIFPPCGETIDYFYDGENNQCHNQKVDDSR